MPCNQNRLILYNKSVVEKKRLNYRLDINQVLWECKKTFSDVCMRLKKFDYKLF